MTLNALRAAEPCSTAPRGAVDPRSTSGIRNERLRWGLLLSVSSRKGGHLPTPGVLSDRVWGWSTLPPEQCPQGKPRHHQQRVADGDRSGSLAPKPETARAGSGRQQPGVEAEGDEQERQGVAEQVQQGLTGRIHQLLEHQQGPAQGPSTIPRLELLFSSPRYWPKFSTMNRLALSSENSGISRLVLISTQPPPQAIKAMANGQRCRCLSSSHRPMATSSTPVSSRINGTQRAAPVIHQRRRFLAEHQNEHGRGSWQRSV